MDFWQAIKMWSACTFFHFRWFKICYQIYGRYLVDCGVDNLSILSVWVMFDFLIVLTVSVGTLNCICYCSL